MASQASPDRSVDDFTTRWNSKSPISDFYGRPGLDEWFGLKSPSQNRSFDDWTLAEIRVVIGLDERFGDFA
jgi:hypothetical protein